MTRGWVSSDVLIREFGSEVKEIRATADTIGAGARPKIVKALTEIHHDVAVAPRYFVQVVFNDLAPGSIYIAGQPADPGHVWIRADIRAGRTDEQKKTLLDRITTEVGQILDVAPEEVWVYICDIPGGNIPSTAARSQIPARKITGSTPYRPGCNSGLNPCDNP